VALGRLDQDATHRPLEVRGIVQHAEVRGVLQQIEDVEQLASEHAQGRRDDLLATTRRADHR
jgi:hypothetical protein